MTTNETRMAHGWTKASLGELIDKIEAGKSFKCDERPPTNTEVGVVKVSAVTWGFYNESESKTCLNKSLIDENLFIKPGDFLFSRANTIELVGACVIAEQVTKQIMLSDKILRFTIPHGFDSWILWSLRNSSGRAEIERLATGNQDSMRNIGQERIRQIQIFIPPIRERNLIIEAIDSYLSRLDAAAASLARVEAKLKAYRASVLKAAVEGRLVPTEAALAKQEQRDYEPASVLLDRILGERRRRWEEAELARLTKAGKPPKDDKWKAKYEQPAAPDPSKLPPLPEGWCWATVEQACSVVVDCHNKTAPYVDDGIPILRTTNIRDGQIRWSELRFVDEPTYQFWSRRCPPAPGDVLFTREAPMGEAAIIPDGSRVCMGQRMMLLRAPGGAVSPGYLLVALLSPPTQTLVRERALGVGVEHLRVGDVEKMPIPVPPLAEQARIVEAAGVVLSVEQHAEADTGHCRARIARLRQAVLKWAFEGKLVDQDPRDEPADVLLARIAAERAAAPSPKTRGRRAKSV